MKREDIARQKTIARLEKIIADTEDCTPEQQKKLKATDSYKSIVEQLAELKRADRPKFRIWNG